MEKLHNMRNKLVKLSGQKVGGGAGGGGVSDSMLKKRLEEESKKIRAEFSEKTKKMIEQEKQIKKLASDYKKVQEDFAAKHTDHARACQDLRDLEISRDQAISQVTHMLLLAGLDALPCLCFPPQHLAPSVQEAFVGIDLLPFLTPTHCVCSDG